MSKRSDGAFERRDRDFYPTPEAPILKLLPHIGDVRTFAEPMCGDGSLALCLSTLGWSCGFWADTVPQGRAVRALCCDVFHTTSEDYHGCQAIISNPPWPASGRSRPEGYRPGWPTVHIVEHLRKFKPVWFLLSADFAHNSYAGPVLRICSDIVSVGRVKWIEGSVNTGKDNAAWYRFRGPGEADSGGPRFHANVPGVRRMHPDFETHI